MELSFYWLCISTQNAIKTQPSFFKINHHLIKPQYLTKTREVPNTEHSPTDHHSSVIG